MSDGTSWTERVFGGLRKTSERIKMRCNLAEIFCGRGFRKILHDLGRGRASQQLANRACMPRKALGGGAHAATLRESQ